MLSLYRDPLGGHWQILAALPIDRVEPTPFQRDLSAAHVKRLTAVLEALGRFLDPIIAVRSEDGRYWKFKAENVKPEQVARVGGAAEE